MLNPILFTENVIGDFLKYQPTTYAFADPDLYAQMRRLLNLEGAPCLSDYSLGHDDRAKQPQPVASRFGHRFLSWQLSEDVAQSWEECRRYAENIRAIRSRFAPGAGDRGAGSGKAVSAPSRPPTGSNDLFGQSIPTDLFGNELPPQGNKRRR